MSHTWPPCEVPGVIPSDKALRLVHSPGVSGRGRRPARWQVDIEVRVADPVVGAALSTVARSAVPRSTAARPLGASSGAASLDGTAPTSGPARFSRLLITDVSPTPPGDHAWSGVSGTATVLVVGPTPYDARWALQTMATVPVHGMVPAQRPADLAEVLASLAGDVVQVPASVVELARAAPALTHEQHVLAELLVAGRSNPEICRVMDISQSGVKRRLSSLFELFEVDNRVQAAAVAAGLGIRPASR